MSRLCPKCGHDEHLIRPGKERGVDCARCGFFFWLPKPENEKTKRPAAHRNLAKKHGRGFCEMCLRAEADLPAGQELHGHHVDEYRKDGSDERENVWVVCTSCHTLIHHQRTYLGHYHRPSKEDAA